MLGGHLESASTRHSRTIVSRHDKQARTLSQITDKDEKKMVSITKLSLIFKVGKFKSLWNRATTGLYGRKSKCLQPALYWTDPLRSKVMPDWE